MLVVGPNGAGKTNLLESLHVGTQGFSPRTRSDRQLIRFGQEAARIRLSNGKDIVVELSLAAGKRATLNGARLAAAEQLRREVATLVFTPDRLVVVKGGPAVRRAYFDRVLGRLAPARSGLPAEYGAAVGQRNAALRRVAAGLSSHAAISPWTEQVTDLGAQLVEARRETLATLAGPLEETSATLGPSGLRLAYDAEVVTAEELEARLDRDLERGATGAGPHLHDVAILAGDRDLRTFGSQGEQRLAVLSLLFAEARLLSDRRAVPPLLLLDDVLSELDPDRRLALVGLLALRGQTFVTSTTTAALPTEPAQLIEVSPGRAR